MATAATEVAMRRAGTSSTSGVCAVRRPSRAFLGFRRQGERDALVRCRSRGARGSGREAALAIDGDFGGDLGSVPLGGIYSWTRPLEDEVDGAELEGKGRAMRLITEAPDAPSLLHVAEAHARHFDKAATVRTVAWLAKFANSEAGGLPSDGESEGRAVVLNLVETFSRDLSLHELTVVALGLAQLRWRAGDKLLARLDAVASSRDSFSPLGSLELALLTWALGSACARGVRVPPAAASALEACCAAKFERAELDIDSAMRMLWGLAHMGRRLEKKAWGPRLRALPDLKAAESLTSQQQAMLASSLVKLGIIRDQRMGKWLLRHFARTVKHHELGSVNIMIKSLQLMGVRLDRHLMLKCEAKCVDSLSRCSPHEAVEFAYQCVKARHFLEVHTRVYVENAVLARMATLPAKDLSILMWSFAKQGHRPKGKFLNRLEGIVATDERVKRGMGPQALSLLIWSFARLQVMPSEQLEEAHYALSLKHLENMNTQCLANVLWSYGRLGLRVPKELFQGMLLQVRLNLHKCNPQNIANVLVSCARLPHHAPGEPFLSAMEHTALDKMDGFSAQGVSNVLWAFVKLGWQPSAAMLAAAQDTFVDKIDSSSPQNVANVVWSLTHLREYRKVKPSEATAALDAIFSRVERKLPRFAERDIATVLWGAGRIKYAVQPGTLAEIESYCVARAGGFSLRDVSLSLWGFSQQQAHSPPSAEVMQALVGRAVEELDAGFYVEGLVNIVWSLSVMNRVREGAAVLERYAPHLTSCAKQLSGYDASKVFCSMVHLDCTPPAACAALMATIRQRAHSYDAAQLESILQASQALGAELYSAEFHGEVLAALRRKGEGGEGRGAAPDGVGVGV